jgi:hypothetical protein
MDNESLDLSDPFIGLSKKQRTSVPGGFIERGSIVSSISRKTCDSSKSGISILSKMTSQERELLDIENKRKEKY